MPLDDFAAFAERHRKERRALLAAAGMLALASPASASEHSRAQSPLSSAPVIANFAALRRLSVDKSMVGQVFQVAGAWKSGDGAHGLFECSNADPIDNSGMFLVSETPGFCFRRLVTDSSIHARWCGAIADGKSHPLSEVFSSLAEAQAVYPHATALTDEIDWCALQAMTNYAYERDLIPGATSNWSIGDFLLSGNHVINKTVVFNHASLRIRTSTYPATDRFALRGPETDSAVGGATSIQFSGPPGNVDQPVPMFDCFLVDEFGTPPVGRLGNDTLETGVFIEGVTFVGGNRGRRRGTPDDTGFVSGLRIRKASFTRIQFCTFGLNLWDGIYFTGPQLFCHVRDCTFYGVFRDAVSIMAILKNFSTTTQIYNNEFGLVGRYDVLCNMEGSVEATPALYNNDHEGAVNSFFVQNPEWFVHGAPSPICIINGGNLVVTNERWESVTDEKPGYWADLHICDCAAPRIENCTMRNLLCTAMAADEKRTRAATAYMNERGYLDITNERNYNVSGPGSAEGANEGVLLKNMYNLQKIVLSAGAGLGVTNPHHWEDITGTLMILSVPTFAGKHARQLASRLTVSPKLVDAPPNTIMSAVSLFADTSGTRAQISMDFRGPTGSYRMMPPNSNLFPAWLAVHPYRVTCQRMSAECFIVPQHENGFVYQCIVPGTSAKSEPTWPTEIGNTVIDGSVVWRCVGRIAMRSDVGGDGVAETIELGRRQRVASKRPESGYWQAGDKIVFRPEAIHAGGHIGMICTKSGVPGVWKHWGAIDS